MIHLYVILLLYNTQNFHILHENHQFYYLHEQLIFFANKMVIYYIV